MPALELVTADNGVCMLRSPGLHALGVPHAFTTRIGGASAAPFDTLNLAGPRSSGGDDDEAHRLENHRRALEALRLQDHAWVGLHLVHGGQALRCDGAWRGDAPSADAVVASTPGCVLKVTTADCAGILIAGERRGAVAAVHAGWRGVIAGATPAAVRLLLEDGHDTPASLRAAIGPCIGREAFEVGDEVADAFEHAGHAHAVHRQAGRKPRIDLFDAIAGQLTTLGIPRDRIDGEPLCTVETPELFFSHRRDRGRTGRMAAIIAPRPG